MDPSSVDWWPAVSVLAVAVALGLAFVWRLRSAPARAIEAVATAPLEVRDLEGKREALFQQLRELEDTGAKLRPEQLARERYEVELQAARVLQELDERTELLTRHERKEAARRRREQALGPAVEATGTSQPALRGFLWGIGSAAAVAALAYFAIQAARPRDSGPPATGEGPARSSPQASAEESQLRAAIARNPDDLEARLDLARVLLARQDLMAVWNETQYVLKRAPGSPRALSYQALVRLAMGQGDMAVSMLKQAISTEPGLLEAYLHLALVYVRLGQPDQAESVIGDASQRFPTQADGLKRFLAEMRAQSETEGPVAVEGDPHAGIPAPGTEGGRASGAATRSATDLATRAGGANRGAVAGSAQGAASSRGREAAGGSATGTGGAGGDRRIAGVVEVDAALKGAVAPGSIVFVTVRDSSFGAGPPLAAKRLPARGFPIRFEITGADSMMGEALPESMLVEARLDPDGDPMTRSPTDPKARLEDVKPGSTDLHLVLRPASPR
jgi:tetratricopeptide (TPR) repeat protein